MKYFLTQVTWEVYTYKSSWILTLNIFANCFKKKKYFPARDVMDYLNIQDGGWLVSLSFNISETKYVIKKLTTDIRQDIVHQSSGQ